MRVESAASARMRPREASSTSPQAEKTWRCRCVCAPSLLPCLQLYLRLCLACFGACFHPCLSVQLYVHLCPARFADSNPAGVPFCPSPAGQQAPDFSLTGTGFVRTVTVKYVVMMNALGPLPLTDMSGMYILDMHHHGHILPPPSGCGDKGGESNRGLAFSRKATASKIQE